MSRRLGEPNQICPTLDTAISEIDDARKQINLLREWGHEGHNAADELEVEVAELKAYIEELEERDE